MMDARESAPFGSLLRRYRLAAGLSQERLADLAGLSTRGISDLERGARRTPRLETVRLLADALHLAPDERAALIRAARPANGHHDNTAPASPRLPIPPTPLVGRHREIERLSALLSTGESRLVTLTGPGGVGKTRLAIEVATAVAPQFPDGVDIIDLAPLTDPGLVASAVVATLGVRELPGRPLDEAVAGALGEQRRLLVFDNFEHLLPAATLVAGLLARCPNLSVLTTSRVPLGLRGERRFPVPPLALPEAPTRRQAGGVMAFDAVHLFVDRARDAVPDFCVDRDDAPVIAEICRRLDGLPLALELAAVRTSTLPPATLLSRLERRLPLLVGGAPDLPERHRTLHATIAWSYDLLQPATQTLFRRLSVFAGGWMLDAAETVANPGGDLDVVDGLDTLVNGSLVRRVMGSDTEPRFGMLETIREYGLEALRSSGEEEATRRAHAAWVLGMVEQAAPALVGPDQALWLGRLDDEVDNLRAALSWSLDRRDREIALRLAAAPWLYWYERGLATEGRRWLSRALDIAQDTPTPLRASARYAAGALAAAQDDYARAESLLEAALDDWRAVGDPAGLSRTLQTLGTTALQQDHNERAARYIEEALGDDPAPRDAVDAPWIALARSQLAAALSRLGDRERADELAASAVAQQDAVGSVLGKALGLSYMGDIALDWDDRQAALPLYRESLRLLWQLGDRWHLLHALTGYLIAAAESGPPDTIARLLGAQNAVRIAIGNSMPPRYRRARDAAIATVRAALGDRAFTAAWEAGQGLTLEDAVAEILDTGTGSRPPSAP